ncbi:Divalent-cation tolerance protein CutA [Planctomycetes bacterium CA13]|uniref:Divalent-cation tolerance protein CutA n=1 Tax=Novipirellula herctigrandis TaxID=2527986 RepID=A0A5C5Z101_9BACT|nr:Divalent-cation tolerance protein CutA [Planctomycetes bacterium CA13]
MSDSSSIVLVLTTVQSEQDAKRLADDLVSQSLAACVQIDGPIKSHYRWAGRIEENQEFRLMIKTAITTWPKVKVRLLKEHPYDEPEIIMIPIAEASDGYRKWIIEQTN